MERNFLDSVQKSEKDTYQLGNKVLSTSLAIIFSDQDLAQNPLTDLYKLEENNSQPELILSLEELEMLEAELKNQSILPQRSDEDFSLSQRAAHEASFLRWKALGPGLTLPSLFFVIDLKKYLLKHAITIAQHLANYNFKEKSLDRKSLWQVNTENHSKIVDELKYLNSFAGYLNGNYENSTNKYQTGLNLILKILLKTRRDNLSSLTITLPIEKSKFLRAIKDYTAKA